MLGLSIDRSGIDKVQKYVEELNITFPNLHDPTATTATVYGIRGVPTTFFIDVDGKTIGMVVGPRPWDGKEAQNLVEHLLAEANN